MKKAIFFILYFIGIFVYSQTSFPHNIVIDSSFGILDPVSVFATDLNNDNKKDLLFATRNYRIYWLKNTNDEKQFDHTKLLYKHNYDITKVTSADVNNDMIVDIVFSARNGLYLMKGIGDSNFAAPVKLSSNDVKTVDVLDINNDGKLDFFVLNQNATCGWLKNDGNGNFSTLISLGSTNAALLADLDNDNIPDLISKTSNYNIEWFKNDGLGNFSKKQTITTSAIGTNIQAADIDSDGDMDIVFLYENGSNQFLWFNNSNGMGLFSGVKVIGTLPTTANINLVRIVDMDNDNKVDLVYSYFPSNIAWKKNMGSGTFSEDKIITQNVKYISDLNIADLNNDGKNDFYSSSEGDDKIAWYQQLDGGIYSPEKILTTVVAGVNKLCIGDIDGDGDDDILTTSTSDYKISWFRNTNGKGDFSEQQHIIANDLMYVSGAQLIDVDNDGDKDVIVRHEYYNNGTKFRILWFENNGSGIFDKQHIILDGMSQNINHISATDIDKDGNIDIVFAQPKGRLGWLKNDGSGNFGLPIYFTDIQDDKDFAMGLETLDMDNDGDLDILVYYNSKSIEWYENTDGTGSFSLKYKILDSAYIISVYPEDIDSDGDLDLLFITGSQRMVGWYENLGNGNYKKNIISTNLDDPKSLIVMDIDGDGKKDVITSSRSLPKFLYYKNNGDKTFSSPSLISNDIGIATAFAFSDFNGDGKKELIVSSVDDIQDGDMIAWFETGVAFENRIKGTIRFDVDNNGCDNNDDSATLVKVTTQNSLYTYSTFTDDEGKYNLIANKDQYNTHADSPSSDYTITPQNYISNFTDLGITDVKNFCISPDFIFNDVEISVYPISPARPGFDAKYKVLIKNKGTQKINGSVDFIYNVGKMSFLNSSTPVASQSSGKIVFNIDDLSPFHTRTIDMNFKILNLPMNNIGDQLVLKAIVKINDDINPEDNEFNLNQFIVGSYDPNDIKVLEGPKILFENKDEWLHYIIRFQNTGNYFAQHVRIQNVLENKLDGSTLTVESYSHFNNIKITNNSLLEVNFDGIYLPGSYDEANSHGYIAYKIKPKPNVKLGDIFNNKAEIYFDYNPLIETNTASTEIVDTLLENQEVAKSKIKIYPNPAIGILNIETTENVKTIEVFNMIGQKVKSYENSKMIDISKLNSGVYFIKVNMENSNSKSFKIIKK